MSKADIKAAIDAIKAADIAKWIPPETRIATSKKLGVAKARNWRAPKKTTATSAKKPKRRRPKRTYARLAPVANSLYVPSAATQTKRVSLLKQHHAEQQPQAKCTIKARNWQLKLPPGLIGAFIKILLDHATPAGQDVFKAVNGVERDWIWDGDFWFQRSAQSGNAAIGKSQENISAHLLSGGVYLGVVIGIYTGRTVICFFRFVKHLSHINASLANQPVLLQRKRLLPTTSLMAKMTGAITRLAQTNMSRCSLAALRPCRA